LLSSLLVTVGLVFDDATVCRREAPKSRHGGPDLRRDAAAGGEAMLL
jgi:hypothetical protein